jgi:HD-like signal output (HDOD) protein
VATATAAGVLLERQSRKEADDGFISGLLHDIGKVVLHQYARKQFGEALKLAESRDILLIEAEAEIFGYTHADVGGYLLDQWHLPLHIVEAVKSHHIPGGNAGTDAPPLHRLGAAVHTGDIFVRALLMGSGGDSQIPSLSNRALEVLGIPQDDLPRALKTASDKMSRIQGFLEIL